MEGGIHVKAGRMDAGTPAVVWVEKNVMNPVYLDAPTSRIFVG